MRKLMLFLLTAVFALVSWAIVEEREIMTILKKDGSTVVYDVNDIDKVTFEVKSDEYKMVITPANGEALKLSAVPTVFRVAPAKDGDPYLFGLTTVEAADPAAARQGKYAVELSVSALKMNTASVDLAGGAASGVSAILYTYENGEVKVASESQTSGTLTTAVNNKTKAVTINLEATYADGTTVLAEFEGAVQDVADLKGFNPPYEYVNEGQYFNPDGNPMGIFKVEDMKYTANVSKRGVSGDLFEFTLSNGKQCWFILDSKYFNNVFDFATGAAGECYFYYDNIQLVSKGTEYMNQGKEGTISVNKNEDNTFTINFSVSNLYTSSFGYDGGTPEYVVLNYTSKEIAPEPEPEPEPVTVEPNTGKIIPASGNETSVTVDKLTAKEGVKQNGLNFDKFELELSNSMTFTLYMNASLYGQKINFADAANDSYYLAYGNGSNNVFEFGAPNSARPGSYGEGFKGSLTISKNDYGYVIDLDCFNAFKRGGQTNDTGDRYVLNYTALEPQPEPIDDLKNQLQHFNGEGKPEWPLAISKVSYSQEKAIPYNSSSKGDRFDIIFEEEKAPTFYFIVDPAMVGTTIDLSAPASFYYIKYGSVELASGGLSYLGDKVGKEGSIKFTKQDDGSYIIDLDIKFKSSGNPDSKEYIKANCTTASIAKDPEPEPELNIPVDPNTSVYIPASGSERKFTIEKCNVKEGTSFNGLTFDLYELPFTDGMTSCKVYIAQDQYNKKIDFANAPDNSYYITYGFSYSNLFDFGANNTKRPGTYNVGQEGWLKVTKNENGTIVIDINASNKVKSGSGFENGDGSKFGLNYTEAQPEPEPEVTADPNTSVYTPASGSERKFTIEKCNVKEGTSFNGLTFDLYELPFTDGMTSCKVYIAQDQYNQKIDFANAPDNSYYITYGFSYSNLFDFGANNTKRPGTYNVGQEGWLRVTKNENGTVVIDIYASNKVKSGAGFENGDGSTFILNYTEPQPEPEPEPEPAVDPNTAKWTQSSGTERSMTVEGCTVKTGTKVNGLTFDQYSLTLSGDMVCNVCIAQDQYGKKINFADAPDNSYWIEFGFDYSKVIQLGANNTVRTGTYNVGKKGSLMVTKNENGTVVIDLDVTNEFKSGYGYDGGDGATVVLNYTEPQPEPEPEPDPIATAAPNTAEWTQSSGTARTMTVESCTVKEGTKVNGLTFDQYSFKLSGDMVLNVCIAPDQYGNKIDFASAPDNSYWIEFGFDWSKTIQLGANNTVRTGTYNVGQVGWIKVTKNDAGYEINFDATNTFKSGGGYDGGDGSKVAFNYSVK